MQWFAGTAERLEKDRTYSRKELIDMLREDYPYVSRNSYQWGIAGMLENGLLVKIGHNQYRRPDGQMKEEYTPRYSEVAGRMISLLRDQMPETKAILFETALLNEFLPEKISENVLFLETEKDSMQSVFRMLQEQGIPNLIYKPTKKDFLFYRIHNCVVVGDLTSEAPVRSGNPYEICIEKLLTDLFCDRLIRLTYPTEAFCDIVKAAQERYLVQSPKLLRYARRRGREGKIAEACPELAADQKQAAELKLRYAWEILCTARMVVDTLPQSQQEFYDDIVYMKLSQAEIAELYNITPQAVTNRIKKLYAAIIRGLVTEYGHDEAELKRIFQSKRPLDFLHAMGMR